MQHVVLCAAMECSQRSEHSGTACHHSGLGSRPCTLSGRFKEEHDAVLGDDLNSAPRQLYLSISGFESSHSGEEAMAH